MQDCRELTADIISEYENYLLGQEYSMATIGKYMQAARSFCAELAGRELTKTTVLAYKEQLLASRMASTANVLIAAINNFLAFVGRQDCRVRPIKIQHSACRDDKRELTKEEYDRLLSAAKAQRSGRLYYLLQTICSTGIRVSEVRYITVEAVRKGRAQVHNKGKSRTIFLPKTLCRKLRLYCSEHKIYNGCVFATRSGRPLDRSNIWAMMKRLCSAANVKASKVFPHNLRHLFARAFYGRHHDLDSLAVILGHSNINTTRIYTQTSEREYQKAVDSLHLIL